MFSCTGSVMILTYIHFWTCVIILMSQAQLNTRPKPSPYKWVRLRFSIQLHWIIQVNDILFNFYISHTFGYCVTSNSQGYFTQYRHLGFTGIWALSIGKHCMHVLTAGDRYTFTVLHFCHLSSHQQCTVSPTGYFFNVSMFQSLRQYNSDIVICNKYRKWILFLNI